MRTCAAKVQLPSECRISHSSQSTYFDAVALGSGAIDQTLKDGFQIPTTPEQEVPAVLGLIDRERVLAVHLLLFGHIQGQTETLGEPTPQDLLQAPYRAGLAQGI